MLIIVSSCHHEKNLKITARCLDPLILKYPNLGTNRHCEISPKSFCLKLNSTTSQQNYTKVSFDECREEFCKWKVDKIRKIAGDVIGCESRGHLPPSLSAVTIYYYWLDLVVVCWIKSILAVCSNKSYTNHKTFHICVCVLIYKRELFN